MGAGVPFDHSAFCQVSNTYDICQVVERIFFNWHDSVPSVFIIIVFIGEIFYAYRLNYGNLSPVFFYLHMIISEKFAVFLMSAIVYHHLSMHEEIKKSPIHFIMTAFFWLGSLLLKFSMDM